MRFGSPAAGVCLGFLAVSAFAQTLTSAAQVPAPTLQNYARIPLGFEKQAGGSGERFVARGQGYVIGLELGKATIGVVQKDKSSHAVSLEFEGSKPSHAIPGPELPGKINYIRGNDPRKWQIGLSSYERVTYPDTYPGIDVVYYGNQQQLEFDLVVKPGANPDAIRLKVEGADKLSIDRSGALAFGETAGGLKVTLPQIYQEVNGTKKNVRGHYTIAGRDEVAFRVDSWDHTRPLVIDPAIVYSALFGGSMSSSGGQAIALDSNGNIFIAGYTYDPQFPTVNAAQSSLRGYSSSFTGDAFVSKINAAGTAFVYSTFLGGSSYDSANGIAVDSTGAAWVTGYTESSDFPVLNAAQPTFGGAEDAFVARFNSAGVMQFSTYLGGSSYDYGYGIAVDSSNNGYATGFTNSTDFPTTAGVVDTASSSQDGFATKYSSAGVVLYSTLLGGGSGVCCTQGYAIAADSAGDAYVTGNSGASTFSGAPGGGAQTTNNGGNDAFAAKLNPTGTAYLYFTFLGGTNYDDGTAIAVDASGDAYIGGYTYSTGLATAGAAQTTFAGVYDGFAAELNPAGSAFTYVTYLGGNRTNYLSGLALDGSGNVYLTGYTDSTTFPAVAAVQALPTNGVSLFNSTNSAGSFSTFDTSPGLLGAVAQISINPAGTSAVALTEGGIYRSANGGASWTQQLSGAFYNSDSYLTRSPAAPGTLYAAQCCATVFQSTDDGVTWNFISNPSLNDGVQGILADPLTAATVYLFGGTPPYVSKSTDGGMTFNPAGTGLPAQVSTMVSTTDGSLYAGTNGFGVYKSTDQGGSWAAVNTGIPPNAYASAYSLSASGTTVYFAQGYVYVTTNGGASWTTTPGNFSDATQIAASPQNASVLYVLTYSNTVVESSDGGMTWSSAATGLPANFQYYYGSELVVDPSNSAHVLLVVQIFDTGFVAKLNSTGSALTYSTYLGGTQYTQPSGIATDGAGNAYVTGYTESSGFPITSTALPTGTYGPFITRISDSSAGCANNTVTPGSALAPQFGGTLTFSVVIPSGCSYNASTDQPWAVITSGASGTGAGTVTVQITGQPGTTPLTANLFVNGGSGIPITLPGESCAYSLDMESYSAPAAGGTVTAILTATTGCPWAVTNSYPSVISIPSGASGSGNGTINLTVAPNPYATPFNYYLSVGIAQLYITQTAAGSQASQTISFDAIPNQILGISPFAIAAQASSLLPVSFTSATPAVCKVASVLVQLLSAGQCSITAQQPGNAGYNAASPVSRSFTVAQANPSGTLTAAANSPFAVGTNPFSVAVGDFNGDGIQDLAVANDGSNTVTVLLGNGSGGFAAGTPFAAGTQPIGVAVGDFNGDGFADLAVTNHDAGTVTVLLGNGQGAFAPAANSPFTVGTSPFRLAVGDFNGDGIQDLAVANEGSNTVTVLLGNGSGGFAQAVGSPFAVGASPTSVAAGDFNGDGIQDLAISNDVDSTVTVLLGNGSGGFTAAAGSPFAVGTNPSSVAVGDFNGDGIPDLATANFSNTVTVLLGNGQGGFTPAPNSPFAVGSLPYSVAVADFNGDGIPDLVTANSSSGTVTVLLGNGQGGFTPAPNSPFAVGSQSIFVAAADFNGDGIEDLAVANYGGASVAVLLGTVTPTISSLSPSSTPAGSPAFTLTVNGTNFVSSSTVLFNGTALSTTFGNATQLTATVTANLLTTVGTVGVTVMNPGGSTTNAATFTILPPAVSSVSPSSAPAGSPAFTLTVSGTNFVPGSAVQFNGTALSTTFGNATQLTATVTANLLGTVGTVPVTVMNPGGSTTNAASFTILAPTLLSVSPSSTPAGSPAFTLTVSGTNFVPGSAVQLNGTALSTTFGNATQLTATVTANLLDTVGTVPVTVVNPGGATTNAASFTILAPTLSSVNPSSTPAGSPAFTLTVSGTNFVPGSAVQFNGTALSTTFGNATQLTATVTANLLGTVGTVPVTVMNPGGSTTSAATFTILAPTISSLNPSSTPAGSAAFTLAVSGTNFVPGSAVQFNGTALSTTFGNATQLTATVTANLLSSAGNAAVTVVNPGGSTSNTAAFTIGVSPTQTITFDAVPNQILGSSPFVIAAQASSLLPVGFTSATPAVCKTASVLVQLLSAGTCSISATQPGGGSYNAAAPVTRSFTVSQANPSGNSIQSTGSPFAVGNSPRPGAIGDFNGDGIADIAVPNGGANTVSVLLGNGSGGFTQVSGSPFATGTTPLNVAVGDFNGDGKQDLAIANAGSNNVTILLGDGTGNFSPAPGSPVAATGSNNLAVGDFNGDGIQDLAVADYTGNAVTVLLGNGAAGFTQATGSPFSAGSHPFTLAAGDFNGDGNEDLAVANYSGGNVTILLGNGAAGFTQATGSPFAVGTQPHSLVIADFNGDGVPDIATANFGSNDLSVLLGNGAGGFTAAAGSPIAVGAGPFSVTTGDFNGDGIADIASTNVNSNSISILLGNGSGGFTAAGGTPRTVGTGPAWIAGTDFNGDGLEDLAVINNGDATIEILLGNLTSTSSLLSTTSQANILVGTNVPLTLTVSDSQPTYVPLTGTATFLDGTNTLGTASQTTSPYSFTATGLSAGTHTLTANYSGGSGSSSSISNTITIQVMQPQTISFAPLSPTSVGAAPFNVSATASSGLQVGFTSTPSTVCSVSGSTVTIVGAGTCSITASQAGSATYATATPVTQSFTVFATRTQTITFDAIPNQIFGTSPFAVAAQSNTLLPVTFTSTTSSVCTLADDLVMLLSGGTCSITANQGGNANFNAATPTTRSFTVSSAKPSGAAFTAATNSPFAADPFSMAPGDFNGDGIPDLAIANGNGNTVTVLLGNGSGGFTAAPGSPFPAGSEPVAVAVGDFNGDGFADLALADYGGTSVTVLLGNGSGGFAAAPGSPFTVGSGPQSVAIGDFNGDGIQDLVVPNFGSATVTVLLGNGSGGFAPAQGSPFAVGSEPISVTVADFNRDGILDLATANYNGDSVTVLLGNGSGAFSAAPASPFSVGIQTSFVTVGDFNGDGIPDLAATSSGTSTVAVLLGNGQGGFTPAPNSPFTVGSDPFAVAVGDFNGDGIPDLATANLGAANVTVLLGNGLGGFTPATGSPFTAGTSPVSLLVGDFNGDGVEDLAIANLTSDNVTVLLGGGAGQVGTPVITTNSLPAGTAGVAYSQTLAASNGVTPYQNWTVVSGSLPPGLTLNAATGVIAGTPTTVAGSPFNFSITVQDSANNTSAAEGFSLVIQALSQTITFAPLNNVVFGAAPFSISATASSGLTVSFASNSLTVCTINVATVTILTAGTCSITASQAGGGAFGPATPVTQTFTVNAGSQTITFGPLGNQELGSTPPPLSATASSGLTVGFASTTGSICTVSGTTMTLVAVGTCSITASQAGNASYAAAAPVTQSFTIGADVLSYASTANTGLTQSTFGTLDLTTGAYTQIATIDYFIADLAVAPDGTVYALASPYSNLSAPIFATINPTTGAVTSIGPNTVGVETMAFNSSGTLFGISYTANGPEQLYTVNPATGAATLVTNLSALYNQLRFIGNTAYTTSYVTPSSLYTIDPTTGAGTLVGGTGLNMLNGLGALVGGQLVDNASVGSGGQIFLIDPATGSATPGAVTSQVFVFNAIVQPLFTQTISFGPLSDVTVGVAPFALSATASSGLAVSFGSTTPAVCTVSVNTVTVVAAGTCTIQAMQVGNADYAAAAPVMQSFTAAPAIIIIPPPPPTPTLTLTLSPGSISTTTGGSVSATFMATGGSGSYTFSVSGQPAGVTLGSGSLGGAPTQAGIFSATVTVTDANGNTATASVTINVLGVTTTSLAAGTTGQSYAASIGAAGGTGSYTFSATGLPAGLSLTSSGYLNGTVKTPGTYSIGVTVSSGGLSATTNLSLTIANAGPLSISSASLPNGTVKVLYSQALSATGGVPPYTWTVNSSNPPPGLSVNASGIVSGTPGTAGSFTFGVQVTDTAGAIATATASLTIEAAPLIITTQSLPPGMNTVDYPQQQLAVTGGVSPYTWALASGSSLPSGMSLSSSGVISGVPGVMGTSSVGVVVSDHANTQASATLSLTIRPLSGDLILTAGSLAFSLISPAAAVPPSQTVGVQSTVASTTIAYTVAVSPAAPWLTLTNGTSTPDTITVSLTSAALSLSPGPYQTTITATCTSGSCSGHTQTVSVTLTVTTAPPNLLISTGLLSFATTNAEGGPLTQPINVKNAGGGSLGFATISCEASWCTAGPAPSSLGGGASAAIPITVDPSSLSAGFYRTQVDFNTSGGQGSVPVTLFISANATMTLAPAGGLFNQPAGSAPGNPNGSFLVSVNSSNPVTFSAAVLPGASWLVVGTPNGLSTTAKPATVNYSIDPSVASGLAVGAYYGEIEITSSSVSNSPQDFEVVLNVSPAPARVVPDPEPGGLLFITTVGGVLPPQTVTVYSGSVSPLTFQASAATTRGGNWLSVTPTTGSASQTAPGVTAVSVNTSGLKAGVYQGGVSYSLSATAIRTVNVTLIVSSGGASPSSTLTGQALPRASGCTPTMLVPAQTGLVQSFFAPAGWPTPLAILLFDDCGNSVNNGQIVATFSNGDPPLPLALVDPSQGLYSGTWSPANPSSQVTINVTASAPNFATSTSPLSGAVIPNAVPLLSPNGTLHSFDPLIGGALAPGTIVAIYGQNLASATATSNAVPLPDAMSGSSVIIGGMQAPLYYVSPGQIDAQIPFELQSAQQYQVIVLSNGALTTPQSIQLSAATPGLAASPDGTLIAQHSSDGSLVTAASPARAGEYLVAYLAGLGDTTVQVPSGTASPSSPLAMPSNTLALTINGAPSPIYFAGLTPGLVGLYQMNFQVPAGLPAGNITIMVTQNGQASNQTVLPYQP